VVINYNNNINGVVMVVILVLLTFGLFITAGLVMKSRMNPATAPETGEYEILAAPEKPGERLFHPGHCWVQLSDSRLATVGADNFAQQVFGTVTRIQLPSMARQVRQGEPLVTLTHGHRNLTLVSPVSGTIEAVNAQLQEHPELVNESPYEQGWIVRVKPQNLAFEARNLIHGITASLWREALRTQLMQWFSPRLGPVMQDGGHLVDNFSEALSPEDWLKLRKEFFPEVESE
jgi:glycine cleavage system H protein